MSSPLSPDLRLSASSENVRRNNLGVSGRGLGALALTRPAVMALVEEAWVQTMRTAIAGPVGHRVPLLVTSALCDLLLLRKVHWVSPEWERKAQCCEGETFAVLFVLAMASLECGASRLSECAGWCFWVCVPPRGQPQQPGKIAFMR